MFEVGSGRLQTGAAGNILVHYQQILNILLSHCSIARLRLLYLKSRKPLIYQWQFAGNYFVLARWVRISNNGTFKIAATVISVNSNQLASEYADV